MSVRQNLLHKLMAIIAEEYKVTFETKEHPDATLVTFQEVPVRVKILENPKDPKFLKTENLPSGLTIIVSTWDWVLQGGGFTGAVARMISAEVDKLDQEALKKARWGE